jgi:hypothetical protein
MRGLRFTRARIAISRIAELRPSRRRLAVLVVTVLSVPVVVVAGGLALGGTALALHARGTPSPVARGTGSDALWLGHAWVDGHRTGADVDALARRLAGTGIRDLYVHAGPLDDDGTLPPSRYPRGAWLVGALHRAVPGVRVHAWLGDVVAPDRLVLTDAATRARVLDGARAVLATGFDGVHYDFEPVADGDPGLLVLLRDTAALAHGQGRLVSVAAHQVEPLAGLGRPLALAVPPRWWSRDYLARVGGLVDQVAIMSYDTAMPTGAAYTGYVRRQTEIALRTVPAGTGLLVGLPAYHGTTLTHRGSETVPAAIRGVRLGLGGSAPRPGFGVALYVDFTATAADWQAYRTGWVRP